MKTQDFIRANEIRNLLSNIERQIHLLSVKENNVFSHIFEENISEETKKEIKEKILKEFKDKRGQLLDEFDNL